MAERDENVYKAKLAEQAERYNELPDHGKGEELFQYSNAVKLLQPNLSTSFADKVTELPIYHLQILNIRISYCVYHFCVLVKTYHIFYFYGRKTRKYEELGRKFSLTAVQFLRFVYLLASFIHMDVKLGNLKNMILEKNRLKTFDQWIYHNDKNVSCSSEKMAKAGFFMDCLEDPSSATCFCCLKTLNGWEKNDSPFEEHQKHSPKCLFVKLEKEESELTVCEMLLIAEEVDSNLLELEYSEQIKKLEKLRGNLKNRLIQNRKSVPQLS